MKNLSSATSFAFLLAGALALSGLFVTQVFATEVDIDIEVSSETSVDVQTSVYTSTFSNTKDDHDHHGHDKDNNCEVPPNPTPLPVRLVITKITCLSESDLPNWGLGGPDITANTATNFLASHSSCSPMDHWGFEWGNQHVTNPGDDFVWNAAPGNGWTALGTTNAQGVLTAEVTLPSGTSEIRVREILEPGYLPFSYGANGNKNTNNVSAELYCANDVLNYDNFDFVRNPIAGQTYHCVAWNVRNSAVNQPPTITLIGANPLTLTQGDIYTELGATATDPEQGPIGHTTSGTVNTAVVGTYTLTYTATDNGGLTASVTRTVNVVPPNVSYECSDGIDNDGDQLVDFPLDLGCESVTDNDENNPPSITVLGANPMTITTGTVYSDDGATATDPEDGPIGHTATGAVNTTTVGTYFIVYKATDSKGLSAYATRTVSVIPPNVSYECSDGIDNDTPADGAIDFPLDAGCSSATDNDENNPPILTLLGANPFSVVIGNTFTDPGASSTDAEDGDRTSFITVNGSVNTAVLGSYAIGYNVSDTEGLSAHATRTVNVVPVVTSCSDSIDNDGDQLVDFPTDLGCDSATDDDENNAPIIEILGANPFPVLLGTTYTDPGASSTDAEDGDRTSFIIATGTVNTAVLGSYTIAYSVSDTDGLFAYATRTVNVFSTPTPPPPPPPGGNPPPKCANGGDDDGDGKADYPLDPGCTSSQDDDETDTTGGGGGGGGTPGLQIFNEQLTVVTPSSVKITWNTNLLSDSRVVYGDLSKNPVGLAPQYGYTNTTATATTATSNHEMIITGLPENSVMFFRPVSSNGASMVVGVELVTPLVAGSCTYLEKYLRLGYDNDPVEVTKLQRFLKEYEGFTNLAVTGMFDIETDKAVRAFQDKYGADILAPWNLPANTGYVYYTTQKKVNEIYCKKAFPLTLSQLLEISAYANASQSTHVGESLASLPMAQPTITVTPNAVVGTVAKPVIDLSTVDLSELAITAPVVKLVPQEGELAGGISTEDPNIGEKKERKWLTSLLATLPIFGNSTEETATGTKETTTEEQASMTTVGATSSSLIASVAASVGISSGTFAVWMILFAGIIILGYVMARRNRQSI